MDGSSLAGGVTREPPGPYFLTRLCARWIVSGQVTARSRVRAITAECAKSTSGLHARLTRVECSILTGATAPGYGRARRCSSAWLRGRRNPCVQTVGSAILMRDAEARTERARRWEMKVVTLEAQRGRGHVRSNIDLDRTCIDTGYRRSTPHTQTNPGSQDPGSNAGISWRRGSHVSIVDRVDTRQEAGCQRRKKHAAREMPRAQLNTTASW